jgi:tripartite-type tricarboxylate transporter receptor subunit TctC
MSAELLKTLTGIDIVHVPYKTSTAMRTDIVSGQIQMVFDSVPTMAPLIKAGLVRALGTSGDKRSAILPDVPTIAETGIAGFEATSWYGIFAPTGTAPEIVARINREANLALQQPETRARLAEIATTPIGGTPQEFAHYLDDDIARWAKVVHAAKLLIE